MIDFIINNFHSILLVIGFLVLFFWLIGFMSFVIIVLKGVFIVLKVIVGIVRWVVEAIIGLIRG